MYSQDPRPSPTRQIPPTVQVVKVRFGWSLVLAAVSILAITVVVVVSGASLVGLMAVAALATCAGILVGAEAYHHRGSGR